MNILKSKSFIIAICFLVTNILGCANSIKIKSSVTPASTLEGFPQYSSIKRVVVFPDNLSKKKDADKLIDSLFTLELIKRKIFDVEDPRFFRRMLEIVHVRHRFNVDKDLIIKMGDSCKADAIIYGTIDSYEISKKGESVDISISLTMYDTRTGDTLLTANATYNSESLKPINHIEITNEMMAKLVDSLESAINKERETEAALIKTGFKPIVPVPQPQEPREPVSED